MNDKQKAWFAKYAPLAQQEQSRSGIPASVILAQMIEETGWSTSTLATKYNNMFGVKKGSGWTGKTVSLYDKMEKSNSLYRVYDNLGDSIHDHTKVLMASRYDKARAAANDPMKMVALIHQAGYATNPAYTKNLQTYIKSYNLMQYDTSKTQQPTGTSATKPDTKKPTTTFFDFEIDLDGKPVPLPDVKIDGDKVLDANGQGNNKGKPTTVIEDTFSYPSDPDSSTAYDRFTDLNPPATLPYDAADALNNMLTDASGLNLVGQIIRVVVVLLIIIVMIIALMKMIPGDPITKLAKSKIPIPI